jgi:poly(3-hydroxybutyrate) depolymerase
MASRIKSKTIHLVGYSGGGAVVAMLAAKRKDIASIRTVAGYMDHVALNRDVKVSQLIGSLDPIKAAPRLKSVPQIHYTGRQDKRIPSWVLKNFSNAVGASNCITIRKVNAKHEEGWEEIWERAWSKIPACNY